MQKLLVLFGFICFFSCKNEVVLTDFCKSIEARDFNYLAAYINDYLFDLNAAPMPSDNLGQEENLISLVDNLRDNNSCLDVYIECYACLESDPPQSELRIELEEGDLQSVRVTIWTPEIGSMEVAEIM